MNKKIYIIGAIFTLLGIISIWTLTQITPTALAASKESDVVHGHGQGTTAAPQNEKRLENLFEVDEHEGHDHTAESIEEPADEHAGHGHAEVNIEKSDVHAELGHTETGAEESADEHAGHGHASQESDDGICPEHRVPEIDDALCQGDRISDLRPGEGMKVRLASSDAAAKAGVSSVKPQKIALAEGIDLPGRVEFNRNKLARITPLSAGVMLQVRVQPGSSVRKGELVAEIAMPELSSLKGEFLAANARQIQTEATYQRETNLLEKGISSLSEFQKAEAENRTAHSSTEQYYQQLLNYGLTPSAIEHLLQGGKSSAALPLRAPFSGTIIAVETAVGEAVEPGTPLFTLANLDSLWIEISVPESRIYQIRDKANIQASFDGLPDMVFSGQIFQTGAVVDERSRTLNVLAEVKNRGQRLKVGMFGNVRLLEGDEKQVLSVAADALQNIDGKSYVFVQQESDLFDLRRVQAGAKADGQIIIMAGLSLDDQVVVSQGFALKSEVLKARLGASCADH